MLEKIALIGIGKIGLCFALNLERSGYEVLGIDTNREYVRMINDKTLRSPEPGVEAALQAARNFRAHHQLEALLDFPARLIFIAVPTPTAPEGGYDHRLVDDLLQSIYALGPPSQRKDLVVMCTTLPGYCDTKAGEALAHHYYLSYNPEFIAQGRILHDQQYPDQVLIGEADPEAGDKIVAVYRKMCLNHPAFFRMSRKSAEIAKIGTNCFLTMKISFANAIGDLAQSVGADTDKILAAIGADARIGEKYLHYGFGYGGTCFPRDNRALHFFASQHGHELFLSKATDEVNRHHLDFQVKQYLQMYSSDESIHFYSVTYKPETTILEESQPLALAFQLAEAGRKVVIHERKEVIAELLERFGSLFEYRPHL